jgi:hypothetical protein
MCSQTCGRESGSPAASALTKQEVAVNNLELLVRFADPSPRPRLLRYTGQKNNIQINHQGTWTVVLINLNKLLE